MDDNVQLRMEIKALPTRVSSRPQIPITTIVDKVDMTKDKKPPISTRPNQLHMRSVSASFTNDSPDSGKKIKIIIFQSI